MGYINAPGLFTSHRITTLLLIGTRDSNWKWDQPRPWSTSRGGVESYWKPITLYGQISALGLPAFLVSLDMYGHAKALDFMFVRTRSPHDCLPQSIRHARAVPLDVGVWIWKVVSAAMQLSVTYAPVALNGFGWMLLLSQQCVFTRSITRTCYTFMVPCAYMRARHMLA